MDSRSHLPPYCLLLEAQCNPPSADSGYLSQNAPPQTSCRYRLYLAPAEFRPFSLAGGPGSVRSPRQLHCYSFALFPFLLRPATDFRAGSTNAFYKSDSCLSYFKKFLMCFPAARLSTACAVRPATVATFAKINDV